MFLGCCSCCPLWLLSTYRISHKKDTVEGSNRGFVVELPTHISHIHRGVFKHFSAGISMHHFEHWHFFCYSRHLCCFMSSTLKTKLCKKPFPCYTLLTVYPGWMLGLQAVALLLSRLFSWFNWHHFSAGQIELLWISGTLLLPWWVTSMSGRGKVLVQLTLI